MQQPVVQYLQSHVQQSVCKLICTQLLVRSIPEQVRPGLLPKETLWVKDLLEYAFWPCLKRSAQIIDLFLSMFCFFFLLCDLTSKQRLVHVLCGIGNTGDRAGHGKGVEVCRPCNALCSFAAPGLLMLWLCLNCTKLELNTAAVLSASLTTD